MLQQVVFISRGILLPCNKQWPRQLFEPKRYEGEGRIQKPLSSLLQLLWMLNDGGISETDSKFLNCYLNNNIEKVIGATKISLKDIFEKYMFQISASHIHTQNLQFEKQPQLLQIIDFQCNFELNTLKTVRKTLRMSISRKISTF